jgi:hypothetical protein
VLWAKQIESKLSNLLHAYVGVHGESEKRGHYLNSRMMPLFRHLSATRQSLTQRSNLSLSR